MKRTPRPNEISEDSLWEERPLGSRETTEHDAGNGIASNRGQPQRPNQNLNHPLPFESNFQQQRHSPPPPGNPRPTLHPGQTEPISRLTPRVPAPGSTIPTQRIIIQERPTPHFGAHQPFGPASNTHGAEQQQGTGNLRLRITGPAVIHLGDYDHPRPLINPPTSGGGTNNHGAAVHQQPFSPTLPAQQATLHQYPRPGTPPSFGGPRPLPLFHHSPPPNSTARLTPNPLNLPARPTSSSGTLQSQTSTPVGGHSPPPPTPRTTIPRPLSSGSAQTYTPFSWVHSPRQTASRSLTPPPSFGFRQPRSSNLHQGQEPHTFNSNPLLAPRPRPRSDLQPTTTTPPSGLGFGFGFGQPRTSNPLRVFGTDPWPHGQPSPGPGRPSSSSVVSSSSSMASTNSSSIFSSSSSHPPPARSGFGAFGDVHHDTGRQAARGGWQGA
ncbi:hypothetical protein QBC47DRAFT_373779 [Echria macrotheca]|uniref:Uncharacterized protein n=1 Tax=Echria macrotheca TaxID=438768 RepID=A0AAJ0BLM6_9PEZI|nr:hypothetical protein QBC47DRAFT_373779 [Echria macrotheca]